MSQVINFKNMNVIKHEWMKLEDFVKIDPVPMQRFTEGRAKQSNVKKMLSKVSPEQVEVAIVELTEDSEYLGTKYKAGWIGIVNGNTRKYYWINKLTNFIPAEVHVTRYYFDSMDEVRRCYDTFDSMDATEKKSEKVYGILVRSFNYTPQSTKIEKGQIITALAAVNHFYNPSRFAPVVLKVEDLPEQVLTFLDEIKAFDKICANEKNWDQALIAAALMAFKKYGVNDAKLLAGLKRIDTRSRVMNDDDNRYDGITHINEEWVVHQKLPGKGTGWEKDSGLKNCISFTLYWINKWMEDQKISQLGFNWRTTADTFFPKYNALNSFLQIANNSVNSLKSDE